MARLVTMTQSEFNDLKLLLDNLDDSMDEAIGGVGCLGDEGECGDGEFRCSNCTLEDASTSLSRLVRKIERRNGRRS